MKPVPCEDVIHALTETSKLFRAMKIVPNNPEEAICAEVATGMFQVRADHLLRAAAWLKDHGWVVDDCPTEDPA